MPDIRRLGAADREAWLKLRRALWPEADATELASELDPILAAPDRLPAFGLYVDDRLIGFAEAGEREWGDGCVTSPVAWVEAIYIEPGHRRQGYGAQLIAAIIDWARSRGHRELGSDVEFGNEPSLSSHRHWGFEETERLVLFRKQI